MTSICNYIKTLNLIIVCFLGITLNVSAQMRPNHEGYFDVRSATTVLVEGNHILDSRLQLFLSDEALNALNSGVPLTIELSVEIIRTRRFLPDAKEVELEFQYELEYRPLSQRYIVKNVQNEIQDSYSTLFSALRLFVDNSKITTIKKKLFINLIKKLFLD